MRAKETVLKVDDQTIAWEDKAEARRARVDFGERNLYLALLHLELGMAGSVGTPSALATSTAIQGTVTSSSLTLPRVVTLPPRQAR